METAGTIILTSYYSLLAILAIFGLHRLHLVLVCRRKPVPALSPPLPETWPSLAIQLPLYNEPAVAARLIDAAASIEYPGTIEIQVLDDSDDGTTAIVAHCVAKWASRGRVIRHIRRPSRRGYKAGALQYGMTRSAAELFAIFDADFVPPRDFLLRTVPHFGDRSVGMVQAGWEHINASDSLLTRAQEVYLDAHFAIESSVRHRSGCFFNFNGTAGVWRRAAIEEAGGWSSRTVTEDLDLSYRSQLAGWRFRFLDDLSVPAELPPTMTDFQGQQRRWVRGAIQTARMLVPRLLGARLPLRVKIEALFHLTNNSAYLFTLLLALLIVPALWMRTADGLSPLLALDVSLFAASTLPVLTFYREGQRRKGKRVPGALELVSLLPIGIGLSLRNGAAVIEGLLIDGGVFRRTPKRGDTLRSLTSARRGAKPVGETALAIYLAAGLIAVTAGGGWAASPFLILFITGYGLSAWWKWRERGLKSYGEAEASPSL